MRPGEELVIEPFQRLMEDRQLVAVPYDGFWRNMDTFKDKMELDELCRARDPAVGALARRRPRRRPSLSVAGRRGVSRSGAGSRR